MNNIIVEYDGTYPVACMGTLKITINDDVIYEKQYCCTSTGSAGFDENWQEEICTGDLIWNDAEYYSLEIQEAVKDKLSEIEVCCGGCL